VCNITFIFMSKTRISNPRTKTGDIGRSNLISGYRIRKSSSICSLQNELQFLRNCIYLFRLKLKQEQMLEQGLLAEYYPIFDQTTSSVINAISASAYFKFDNEKFAVSQVFLHQLEQAIDSLTEQHTDCPEFFIPNQELTILGDNATTQTRKAENHFWIAVEEVYSQHDRQDLDSRDNLVITSTAQFLNMFSDFLFLYNRLVHFSFGFDSQYWENKECN